MLTGPVYMLQIYDRVLASQSVPTLLVISGIVVGSYLLLGFFDILRMWLLGQIAQALDVKLADPIARLWITNSQKIGGGSQRPLSNLEQIKGFLTSTGPTAIFDMPWVPLYVAIVFMVHFWLGILTLAGVVIVLFFTILNELFSKKNLLAAGNWNSINQHFVDRLYRSGGSAIAMGLVGNALKYWGNLKQQANGAQLSGSQTNHLFSGMTKVSRMILQSAILGVGAYLAIHQEISPGSMIMASIIAGRALAPIDAAIGNWKPFVRARQSYGALSQMFQSSEGPQEFKLEDPIGKISVSGVTKIRPGDGANELPPILTKLDFELKAGETLALLGHSASGKTSLTKLLVGIWMPDEGSVRLDSATFDQWDIDVLGKHIGYMPQSIDLMPGTIAQNIARFDPTIKEEAVIEAAKHTGVHEMILSLPKGYNTVIDEFNSVLSGGQIQRIALARAIVTKPKLLVLDEPNSNLDQQGELALLETLKYMKSLKTTIIIAAHKSRIVDFVDKVLILEHGNQMAFGDRDKILVYPGKDKVRSKSPRPMVLKANK